MLKFKDMEKQEGNWGMVYKNAADDELYVPDLDAYPEFTFTGRDWTTTDETFEDDYGREWRGIILTPTVAGTREVGLSRLSPL